ncbi:MAG: hypothetical protein A2600_10970 [Candidatus Lambdaproteobacteria bacterium RIFOXYD1_FULL_56_27]|uniref:Uncharacterized protein n=1 Tax=Candidatus Lambdaproteobacteria bacterium RIFOXYD2_FULL_56_26 TaxID=1817773 RepID=A0A1F6H1U4_9PROT|nr:MAG: hypothetical protein A2557_10715 [Candidatus Lambdaproteobacteria bacterium RIFOXYD2_FULL_56_26]OGH05707.1 MAG: hypothetical protein A2426_04215 [Candidatus Lambdaproteobacteria bacterium RIFOXYC1_FULL_56_13]OGH08426.1 MAG: hypothetical protein A2600_10970 [Candidatus Lambdaproteobacteria bacterium RIFOXYD1_FULL_56_27]
MSKRIKKLGGQFGAKSFNTLAKQIEGKGVLWVTMINTGCPECQKIQDFINLLKSGWIDKLPNLVACYGYSNIKADAPPDPKEKPKEKEAPKKKTGKDEPAEAEEAKAKKALADSNLFAWESLPQGHGYALFTSPQDVQIYGADFDHEEFKNNLLTTIRRYKSPVKTLAGLPGKRQFMDAKRTGIIVETTTTTANSEISAVEQEAAKLEGKLAIKIYFCKGITQEICLVKDGAILFRNKGLALDKFLKKMPKMS